MKYFILSVIFVLALTGFAMAATTDTATVTVSVTGWANIAIDGNDTIAFTLGEGSLGTGYDYDDMTLLIDSNDTWAVTGTYTPDVDLADADLWFSLDDTNYTQIVTDTAIGSGGPGDDDILIKAWKITDVPEAADTYTGGQVTFSVSAT